jgi:hypothetical protein
MKALSIIGLCIAGLSYICLVSFNNVVDYEAGLGWGLFATVYLIALSIVSLVQANRK